MAIPYPHINPVAIALGPIKIRWYALAYLTGFLAGWRYILYLIGLDQDRKDGVRRVEKTEIDDFMSWAIIGVILGGRIGYVLFYQLDLYMQHPLAIFEIWRGGMSFHGGAMGVIVAMIVFARRRAMPLLRLTDLVCCAVPIGLFFGRIANFINDELYGRVTDVPWAVIFPNGGNVPRHPSQIYEAVLEGLVMFTILALMARRKRFRDRPGILSGVFLIGYALCRITVENFRQPDAQLGFIFDDVTMGQILSAPMIVFGLILIVRARKIARKSASSTP